MGSLQNAMTGFAVAAQKQMEDKVHRQKKKVIVLAGPTAVGKTALSLQLAEYLGGEIVSADSMQVYKGMDIGTAKPTLQERKRIVHYMIDCRDVDQAINVVDFCLEALECCQNIVARELIPIIVGGSGFYLQSLLFGVPQGPPSVPKVRASIEKELSEIGIDALFEKLRKMDPKYAATITCRDRQKIVRALEIMQITGKLVSRFAWNVGNKTAPFDFRCWCLSRPKEILWERIEKRCHQMIDEGLLEEVEQLEKSGLLENPSAAQAIGYKQALEYLHSDQSPASYQHFLESFVRHSRKYAKRQLSWFKKERAFRFLNLEMHDPEIAMEIIRQDFEAIGPDLPCP